MSEQTTADYILSVLRTRHNSPIGMWLFIPEMRLGTGYGGKWEQRIDAFALNCYPSTGLQSVAYEIKVSRGDFLRELKDPQKRQGAMDVSNEFYFAAPLGIIKPDELPHDCGLIEIAEDERWKGRRWNVTCRAGFRDRPSPSWRFLASVARRILAAEEEIGHE